MMSYSFKSLLPYKAFYFFAYGASGTIVAFLPVFLRELGLTPAEIATIIGLPFFFIIFSNPIIGYISDKFRIHKNVLMCLILAASIFVLPIYYLPSIPFLNSPSGHLKCFENDSYWIEMEYDFHQCADANDSYCNFSCVISHMPFFQDNEEKDINITTLKSTSILIHLHQNNIYNETKLFTSIAKFDSLNISCDINSTILCSLQSCTTPACFPKSKYIHSPTFNFYFTYQFWICLFFFLIFEFCRIGSNFLADAITIHRLKDKPHLFGKQRLIGAFSWGLCCVLFSYLDDIISAGKDPGDYTVTFYAGTVFYIITFLIVFFFLPSTASSKSHSILKDISSILKTFPVSAFALMTCIHGMLHRFVATFLLWYMKGLNASKLCMGIFISISALSDIPCYFFSGYIIKKLGNIFTLCFIFLVHSLRFYLYSILENPWYFAPVQILNGIISALGLANIVSFAHAVAPPGTLATTQELLGVCFAGIGGILGNLIGGCILTAFGAVATFQAFSVCGLVVSIIYLFLHLSTRKNIRIKQSQQDVNKIEMKQQFQPIPYEEEVN